jgi:hypothetical protein
MHVATASLVTGIILLFFGRKLFWFFVGAAGFMMGMDVANRYFTGAQSTKLVIALLVGIIGAVLAMLFYKAAVAIAGFLIGGYLATDLVRYLAISPPQSLTWIPYVIGGVIGAILILVLFDWALIILSSFSGATLIVHSIMLPRFNMSLVFIILVIIGILVQAGILLSSRPANM